MNLTFTVCWIEDQASDAEFDAVEEAISQTGFEPQIIRIKTEKEIQSFAKQQRHFHDYDLILLDLNLGKGLRGDELAPQIRKEFRSTTILFYSSEDEAKLRKMMADKLVEGAYCVNRTQLSTRIGELISNLSPALNRLSGMRGLSARVVAECDQELRKILLYLKERQGYDENSIVKSLKERVDKINTELTAKILPIKTLDALLDEHAVSSGMLFNTVKDVLRSQSNDDELRVLLRSLRRYQNAVLTRRNILAHALEERDESGWKIIVRGREKPLTVNDFQRYRADFLTHLRGLRKLREFLIDQELD